MIKSGYGCDEDLALAQDKFARKIS